MSQSLVRSLAALLAYGVMTLLWANTLVPAVA